WGDYDNDGFVDLFVSNLNDQNNLLYRNDGNGNNWLTVRCIGQLSNRSAIGTKVRINTIVNGQSQWKMREISGGSGYGSQNAPYAYFGLGSATNVETVRVEWPSGIVQELHGLPVKQFLTLTESDLSVTPASITLNAGETALLSANTTLSPASVQWLHNGIPLPGATAPSLAITDVHASDAGNYSVRVEYGNPPITAFAKPASLIGPVMFR